MREGRHPSHLSAKRPPWAGHSGAAWLSLRGRQVKGGGLWQGIPAIVFARGWEAGS